MLSCDFPPEVQSLFEKRFTYKKEQDWSLPATSEVLSSDHKEFSHLLSLKESLNKVKNLLSDKKLDDWHRHTSFTNKAGKIVPEARRYANAELCTQAWCKFHEIVCTYPLLPDTALWISELNTLHLCEAPGAFISSLNHYLKTQEVRCDWNWVANTLNPYHEANDGLVMIADDRLIANTLPWWYFGPDNTGDIMSSKYLDGLQRFISNMSSVHLVTADGSFDCQGNPGEQETLVYPLHYCEVVTCLATLGPGGSFVLKMFTLFQHSSINLMYLLNCCFQTVHLIKPGTSKAGNSEVYVVCLGYVGKDTIQGHLEKMIAHLGADVGVKSLFPHHFLPESFLQCHQDCCTYFYELQTQTILENLQLFSHMSEEDNLRLKLLREASVSYYMQKFQIAFIPKKHWLVRKPQVGCSFNTRWVGTRNRRTDTYNERKQLEALSWHEKVSQGYFTSFLEDHVDGDLGRGCFLEGSSCELRHEDWYFLQGPRHSRIQSSSFCDCDLLKKYNESIEQGSIVSLASLSCPSCPLQPAGDVVSSLLELVQNGHHVLVCGAYPVFEVLHQRQLSLGFLECPPLQQPVSLLHDGDPAYQQQLLSLILQAFQQLQAGDSFLLPILSSLTRFTAGIVYILCHCFQIISFSCPTSHLTYGTNAVLFCCGYHPLPSPVLQSLHHLKQLVEELVSSASPQQVLEFVPMEELLKGPFLEFLWDLNSTIIRRSLHVIGLHEQEKTFSDKRSVRASEQTGEQK
ncbi:cap-specific mRNA (nucleoside-2'-O-)-methyltransferase 2 [Bufo bufo]|uniref:cap-specific mRNA (nucleoside-2'-O-)-methyltransferase 2 n=1 Tax=Bufo bufo TaxID=8384 RepID=UPI001ABE0D4C|nr:cap-specific mRNA (nucleoside-2'-O-)-methyltransferase 2 [Bufo bufo]